LEFTAKCDDFSMATPAHELPLGGRFLRISDGGPSGRCPAAAQERLLEMAQRARLDLVQARGLELIHRGDEHYRRLIEAIESAKREVCVEMYQIRADAVGWRICTALNDAALRGVSVRLLLDSFGSARVSGWLPALRRHGIDVRWYNPWRPWRHPFHRTHRKLIVVDGRLASIGGINLASEFSERHSGGEAWRDVALWMEGPAAWLFRRQFDVAWGHHGGAQAPPVPVPSGAGTVCAVAGPRVGTGNQASGLTALCESARTELLLATPYFLPDRRFKKTLRRTAERGVRVVVAVPRRNDIWWFKHGSRRVYADLLRAGVEIVERCDRMVHAKVGVVDGLVAAVGSTNLNRQSFYGNSETLMLTTAPAVVEGIRELIVAEAAGVSESVEFERWATHPDRHRMAELAATFMRLIF
jgi:cardiolipin synthase